MSGCAHRWLSALVAVTLTASLVACTKPETNGSPAPTTSAGPEPAISEDEAETILAELSTVNNKANAARDSALLATYEAESSLLIDDASYIVDRATDAKPGQPFTYTLKKAYIPAGTQWFVLDTTFDNGSIHSTVVMARDNDGADWKLVIGAANIEALPEIDTDRSGDPIAVEPDDAEGLIAAPADIAKAHATFLTEGTASAEAAKFGDSTRSKAIIDSKAGLQKGLSWTSSATGQKEPSQSVTSTITVAPYPVRSLRTRDGGALIIYTTKQEAVATHATGVLTLGGKDAGIAGKKEVRGTMTAVVLDQWVAYVPPKGGGKVKFIGNLNATVSIA